MKSKMTVRRLLAIAGIILLLLMYILAFVFAMIDSPQAAVLFRASIACTILVPIFLYVFLMVARTVRPSKSPLIDTIVFDVGNVLIDFDFEREIRAKNYPQEVNDIFFGNEVFNSLWREYDLGNLSDEEIRRRFLETFPDHTEEVSFVLDNAESWLHIFPYTMDWLASLKQRGYRLYVLSNWSDHMYRHIESTGESAFTAYMDGCLWSYQHHLTKPDPAIYRKLASMFNIDPKRAVFIDDMKENTAAAAKEGFNTITFKDLEDTRQKLRSVGVKW
ncbi:MAG: HAD family phosphatase [Lachnospiraceae bacterium]|nr:HAD family phosphatase [Lachnospiraceae bacterium]